MEDNKSGCGLSSGGISFSGKLTGVISWSWLWVLAPIWISTILAIILIIISAVLNWIVNKL